MTNSLVNIKAITAHFNPKIEAWLASLQLSTPTEDQILEVVKSNYDSLTLKLQVWATKIHDYEISNSDFQFLLGRFGLLWKICWISQTLQLFRQSGQKCLVGFQTTDIIKRFGITSCSAWFFNDTIIIMLIKKKIPGDSGPKYGFILYKSEQ